MSNINQIKTQGSGIQLDKIEVVADYGVNAGKTNHRALLVKDLSDQTIVKIWGTESNQPWAPGSIITITASPKGKIEASEWKGKISLNCNDCKVTGEGEAPPQTQSEEPASGPAQQEYRSAADANDFGPRLNTAELCQKQQQIFAAHCKVLFSIAKDEGAPLGDVLQSAAIMTGSVGEFWHGAKYPQ